MTRKKSSRISKRELPPAKNDGVPLSEHEAVWQYIIDHGLWTPYGYKVMFWVRNRSMWDWKIRARMDGVYRIAEKEEEEKLEREAQNFFITQKINNKFGVVISKIDKHGSWYDKLMLKIYRKSRDYIQCKAKKLPDLEPSELQKFSI
jgi:hypothetical protein